MDYKLLQAFVCVAKRLSFAQAANDLSLSPPQISKLISQLEYETQKSLFIRSTRKVTLTLEGAEFLPVANRALAALQETSDFFQKKKTPKSTLVLTGNIRIAAPQTIAHRLLSEKLAQFHQAHPCVSLELILSDSYVDLIENNIDLAFRVMVLHDSTIKVVKIADNPLIFCASPKYLKKAARLKSISDLKNHPVLAISHHRELSFKKSAKKLRQLTRSPWISTTNGDLLVEQAKLGTGVLVRSRWGVQNEIANGELIEVNLDDQLHSKSAVYLAYPEQKFMPERTRVFIDFIKQSFI